MDRDLLSRPQIMPTSNTLPAGEIVPLNITALTNLGEPDPGNITKQDLLQSIAFDK
jgi:hypothetical protein